MRLIVDKMPKKTDECIFGQNGPQFRGHRYCELSNGTHYCDNVKECPYLMPLVSEVQMTMDMYDCDADSRE